MIFGQRTVFGAGLENAVLFANDFDQKFTFIDGEGGFFALDIFTRASRHDADQGVPVIGGRDHHRINIFAGKDIPKIFGHRAILSIVLGIHHGFGAPHPRAVHIAHHQHLGFFELEVAVEIPGGSVVTGADKPDGDLFAGRVSP